MAENIVGVYVITCNPTGKIYIGSSSNIQARWRSHRSELRRGVHGNGYLQNAWNKYGEAVFELSVIETCAVIELQIREQHWIDELHPFGKTGFNIAKQADCPARGIPLSDEHKAKLSASKRGRPSPKRGVKLSKEHRAKMSKTRSGRKLSEIHVAAMSLSRKGKPGHKWDDKSRQKLSKTLKGRKFSNSHRSRIAESLGKPFHIVSPTCEEFNVRGLKEFCNQYGLNYSAMCNVASGRRKTHRGWRCERVGHDKI